ncbi:molybdopterin molybdenumtransferase MoeA [Rhodobacteraceae bacterium WD3A24]|nr:molybdopterin molybdenumtransferase MoeA [Rhodobacteraceae bacterium WD3A24]
MFDRVAILDWSAAGTPKSGRDSIWLGVAGAGGVEVENPRTRVEAERRLARLIDDSIGAGERLLIGMDFAFGYPAGFAARLTGRAHAPAVWEWLAAHVSDTPDNRSTYRDAAARMNAYFAGDGPFWGNNEATATAGLPRRKPALPEGLAELRATDRAAGGSGGTPKPVWQLAYSGAVGAQTLTAQPMLHRLRAGFAGRLAVWPFDPPADARVVVAEVYPSMLSAEVRAFCRDNSGVVPDEAQVRLMASAFLQLATTGRLSAMFDPPAAPDLLAEEGWILAAGHEMALRSALPARTAPPRLRDDCFAMPQGVDWVPVDTALEKLRAGLHPVAGTLQLPPAQADGHVLAEAAIARRANPPAPNSAVDGYGFAHLATGEGPQRLPLLEGRAAAGQPWTTPVPEGAAIRILTGAILPPGVDTVVLDEDTARDGAAIVFDGPVRAGANTRRAGEDVAAGSPALPAGRRLTPPDLALLTALGVGEVTVRRRLRVAVLSTGDELVADPARPAETHQIFDANRPMLLATVARWGHEPVDLGHAPDDEAAIAAALDRGADGADVILTSGGASAGDEDHVSKLLQTRAQLTSWRIALKPGRPLALAVWNGAAVFGLPGNPVAAFVCTLIFARPALSLMAGAGWLAPQGFTVPAAFSKSKKPGRREYLRARLDAEGRAEVFASEGSGRISGLSWADGLVELADGAAEIGPGAPVRYIPYASFGL